jgi:hypothetical protein
MKKNNFLLLSFSFCVLTATAQIPNFSFENWTNKGSYEIPTQWGTLNNTTASNNVFTVTKASPGSPGSFYMKITSKTIGATVVGGIAVCGELDSINKKAKSGFAYSAQPASFTGKWQHMIFGTSQGSVKAILTKWNVALNKRDTIGIASKTLTGMAMSWANFTVNFVYFNSDTPDSCIIELRSSGNAPTDQDYLWVDNLGFTGVATGIDVLNTDNDAIEVYPNPTTSVVNIRSKNSGRVENVILFDILGNKLLELNEIPENGIDISKFTKGNYFVQIKSNTALTIKKISLQ